MPRQPKTPDQIRQTHGRRHLHLSEQAILPACLRLCAQWHNAIGGCLTLDAERFRLLHRRLVAEREPACTLEQRESELHAAIEAYSRLCQTSVERAKRGIPPRTFASFLGHDGLESWIERGLAAQQKQSARSSQQSADAEVIAEKRVVFQAIEKVAGTLRVPSAQLFGDILRQAYLELVPEDPNVGSTFDDRRIRARMLALARQRAVADPRGLPNAVNAGNTSDAPNSPLPRGVR